MKWIVNTNKRNLKPHDYYGSDEMLEEWFIWLEDKIIDKPQPICKGFTVEQLESMDMVGIYSK